MKQELAPIFERYRAVRAEADALFARMSENYPACVKCKPACSDCCHALFDLSLVEAMYLNNAFQDKFGHGPARSSILAKASGVDRALTRLKRDMFRAEKAGEDVDALMARAASERSACPLLDENRQCSLYEERPITCRLYGIPLAIGQSAHACGYSGFDKGASYPAVRVAKIQEKLEALSAEIARTLGSRFELDEVYVPVSMALLTAYDDQYLGVGKPAED